MALIHHAVDRSADHGARKVHLRLVKPGFRREDFGIGFDRAVRDQRLVGAARACGGPDREANPNCTAVAATRMVRIVFGTALIERSVIACR